MQFDFKVGDLPHFSSFFIILFLMILSSLHDFVRHDFVNLHQPSSRQTITCHLPGP